MSELIPAADLVPPIVGRRVYHRPSMRTGTVWCVQVDGFLFVRDVDRPGVDHWEPWRATHCEYLETAEDEEE